MKGSWKTAFVVGGALTSVIGAVLVFGRTQSSTIPRVALIGDSYAVGLGPELSKALPSFRYEGHVGTNTWQWAHQRGCGDCGKWIASFRPHLTLVSLGVNDGDSPDVKNYQEIVRQLHGLGSKVIWIEPPNGVQTASRDVVSSLGVATVPATMTPLSRDGLHPASYGPWAREVADVVFA